MRPLNFDTMEETDQIEVACDAVVDRGIFWLPGAMLRTHSRRFMDKVEQTADDASSWHLFSVKPEFDFVIVDTDRWANFSSWLEDHARQRFLMSESGVPEERLPDLPEAIS